MTKSDLNDAIAKALGVASPRMSRGSTEPKKLFLLVNEVLGLGLDVRLSKPNLARSICEIGGQNWSPNCESAGGTVTAHGLELVLKAVLKLTK